MTELEKGVAGALRLTEKAAEKPEMLSMIRRNILTARAELARSGVPRALAESGHPLVEDAVITFCLYKMDDEADRERNLEAFQYQQDNLRKSSIKPEAESEQNEK